ncbi:hypothetical protein AVEN_146076-1 [Araneus ventricosus]|uniref:Uncharacterized protein n=1 Tax=Araneus ventricosus TaxID=182803 RepID=A0A4Y2F3D7_ARAVE|nr:hypothetical protein AVEN_146076-1 [Araneus ventricosus]
MRKRRVIETFSYLDEISTLERLKIENDASGDTKRCLDRVPSLNHSTDPGVERSRGVRPFSPHERCPLTDPKLRSLDVCPTYSCP